MIRLANNRPPPLTPAVSYVRMSTDKQEDSPEQQRDEIRALAAREGFKVVREYFDEGISGTESDKRHEFKRLIKDAQDRGDFQVILCRDQDRFSRFDPLEANHYWFLLRQVGVRIVTARQGELNFDELAGWLTASITQHGKAQYIRDISANVLGARLRNAQQGKWTHNRAPYGYERTEDGRLVLADAERVKTVRWIFKTYVDRDISLRDMAAELNNRGAPGRPRRAGSSPRSSTSCIAKPTWGASSSSNAARGSSSPSAAVASRRSAPTTRSSSPSPTG